jgi:hypothetical protein
MAGPNVPDSVKIRKLMNTLKDKVVLITGAARRVGAEIARALHAEGASAGPALPQLGRCGEDPRRGVQRGATRLRPWPSRPTC